MTVAEQKLHSVRASRPDFLDPDFSGYRHCILCLQTQCLAIRALALTAQERMCELLRMLIAPENLQHACLRIGRDVFGMHRMRSVPSQFAAARICSMAKRTALRTSGSGSFCAFSNTGNAAVTRISPKASAASLRRLLIS